MNTVRFKGQDITNTPVGQEILRDVQLHGGAHADVQPNGDLVINATNDQYTRAVNHRVDHTSTSHEHAPRCLQTAGRVSLRVRL